MLIGIILIVWFTISIVYIAQQSVKPWRDSSLFILEFIIAPYLVVCDILDEYRENKEKFK